MFVPPKLIAELADTIELMTRAYPDVAITMVAWHADAPHQSAVISNIETGSAKANLRKLLDGEEGITFKYQRNEH